MQAVCGGAEAAWTKANPGRRPTEQDLKDQTRRQLGSMKPVIRLYAERLPAVELNNVRRYTTDNGNEQLLREI
jgi:hypothetical protein